jgi:hypothetical protein
MSLGFIFSDVKEKPVNYCNAEMFSCLTQFILEIEPIGSHFLLVNY